MSRLRSSWIAERASAAMQGKTLWLPVLLFSLCVTQGLLAAGSKAAHTDLSVAQIVEKHVAARGGLQAWRAVQTLSVSGKLEAGSGDSAARSARLARGGVGAVNKREHASAPPDAGKADKGEFAQQVQLPFALEVKRPHKSRLEIEFAGKTAVQVYDGTSGWKLRPFLNRNDVEPFTAEETQAEAAKEELDGPLVDYVAKGTKVDLEAVEPVEGHSAYKLKLTAKSGNVRHVWIDAASYLDVKVEGAPRRMDGRSRSVWVYQRDFRSVQGLLIPFEYETVIDGGAQTHKMTVQSVAVNRVLNDSRFSKPQVLVAGVPAVSPAAAASAATPK